MPRARALRTLNVNPDIMQKPVDLKTLNAAFSCTENDTTANKCMLERSLKNAQLLKENKLVKQLKQEALVMEQPAASTSKLDSSLDSPENSESANIGIIEEPDNSDNFQPTELLCNSSDMHVSSHTTATVENSTKVSRSLASSSNIVADLHEKLCSSHPQNKRRTNRKHSQSSDTDDTLPLLNTIVNEILSLEVDFPLPSTSFADTCSNRSSPESRKRCKRQYTRTATKRDKKKRKTNEDLVLASSVPNGLVDTSPSNTPVLSDSDSDCEITGYVPSNSQQINAFSEVHSRNALELNVYDESILELDDTPVAFVSEQHPEDANCTNMRLDSIINMLNDTIQRVDDNDDDGDDDDDDVLIIDSSPQRDNEQTFFECGSFMEIPTTTVAGELTPPVIVVSDDECEPNMKPALGKQLKSSGIELSSQQGAAPSNGRIWQCPICWEELTSARGVYSTMCGHVFCNPCITHVLETTKKCPMCRKSLNKKKVHPLFLDG